MGKQVRYYLARIMKRGNLTAESIVTAMRDPVTAEYRGTRYSFIDFEAISISGHTVGFYAKLAKYKQQGAVGIVREEQHTSAEAEVRNLIDAACPFVYIPEFSGLAYRHVWNKFPSDQFERVFKELIESKYDKFFVGCDIEPIADLRTFVTRLLKISHITELSATVSPPNPLFAPCWKSLGDYLRKRKLAEIQIKEQATAGIETRLKEIAEAVLMEQSAGRLVELMEPLLDGVGDAALLMAADGYGHARIKGVENNHEVIIRTSDDQRSFLFDSDPNPQHLFDMTYEALQNINQERGLKHP
jgi:hypothetical protein